MFFDQSGPKVGRASVPADIGRHPSSHKLRRAKRRLTLHEIKKRTAEY